MNLFNEMAFRCQSKTVYGVIIHIQPIVMLKFINQSSKTLFGDLKLSNTVWTG